MSVCRSELLHLPAGCLPPHPLPSCYATTFPPPPAPPQPQPDPVALPWPDTNRPSYLFLCKKTRGWGPFTAHQTWLTGNEHSSQTLAKPKRLTPPPPIYVASVKHLQTAEVMSSPKTLYQSSAVSLCADDTCVQLVLRVGELMIPSMRCSSPRLSFLLWEPSLESRGHRVQEHKPHASNSILIGREKGLHWILFFKKKTKKTHKWPSYRYCFEGPEKMPMHNVPI